MPLLSNRRLLLAVSEATYGQDPVPGASAAILVRDLSITPIQSDSVNRDVVRPYLGSTEQLLANTHVQCTFTVDLTGSGTPSTAPRFSSLLKACGFTETYTSSAITGTATAGGVNTITLAASASSTDNAYTNLIIRITAGTGSGNIGIITSYVGATKVATVRYLSGSVTANNTSAYAIGQQYTYTPVSSGFGSATIYYNVDGVLHRLTGCRGTFTLSATVAQIPSISFTLTGIYNPPTDTALTSVTYADQATPLVFTQGNSGAFSLLDYAACVQDLSIDLGNNVVYRELIGCNKEVRIVDRAVSGTATIEAPTIATKDYFTAALSDGTLSKLQFIHGNGVGNLVGFAASGIDIGSTSYAETDSILMLNLPFTCVPTAAASAETDSLLLDDSPFNDFYILGYGEASSSGVGAECCLTFA